MLIAYVLICSINLDCTRANSRVIMRVPGETANPSVCAMRGQAYVAESAITVDSDERLKIICIHKEKAPH